MKTIVGTSVEEAVHWLKCGEPVALPTETVYGLAAPLFSEETIRKIYFVKQRPANNPLIVHVLNFEQLKTVAETTPLVQALTERFWPGPLTLVLKKKACVSNLVTAEQASVAVRCPQAPLFRRAIDLTGEPLVAPSANRFQHVSPTTAMHVLIFIGRSTTDTVALRTDYGRSVGSVSETSAYNAVGYDFGAKAASFARVVQKALQPSNAAVFSEKSRRLRTAVPL